MFEALLEIEPFEGYPPPFFLSRIRGRGYCTPLSGAPGAATRRELDTEYSWAYRMMNKGTAKIFIPFFSLFEIERLMACLRLARGHEASQIPQILSGGLLSEDVGALLTSAKDPGDKVLDILSLLGCGDDEKERLGQLIEREQWSQVEAWFYRSCLEWAVRRSRHKALRLYFKTRIDMRNLLCAHKALRWKSAHPPPLLEGGSIPAKTLSDLLDAGNLDALEALGRRRLTQRVTDDLEDDLVHGLAVRLHRRARIEPGVPLVLAHLWGLYASLHQKTGKTRSREEAA